MSARARLSGGEPVAGPRELLGLRSTLAFRRDPLRFLEQTFRAHGDVAQFSLGGEPVLAVFDPERVAALLALPDEALEKASGPTFERGQRISGVGIVTASGETHQLHRSLAQAVLAGPRLRLYRDQLGEILQPELSQWVDREGLDLAPRLRALLRRAAVLMLFGRDLAEPANAEMAGALDVLVRDLDQSGVALLWSRLRPAQTSEAAQEVLRAWTEALPEGAPCVARDLLELGQKHGPQWGMEEVRANLVQLYMTAYDTTVNSLLWTLWLLAHHPEHAERARVEQDWLELCIKESLRLYPTGPYALRRPVRPVQLGDIEVPTGVAVLYSPWVTHRHPQVWEEPEAFFPERFLGHAPPRGAYVPFGLGGRSCVGAALGTLQVRAVVSQILGTFLLEPAEEGPVRPVADDAVRPEPGVRLRLHRRRSP
jgi:cytochrome P450